MAAMLENEGKSVTALSTFQIFMEGGYLLIFIEILCQLNYFILEHEVFFPMELYNISMHAVISACNNCFGESHQKLLSLSLQM